MTISPTTVAITRADFDAACDLIWDTLAGTPDATPAPAAAKITRRAWSPDEEAILRAQWPRLLEGMTTTKAVGQLFYPARTGKAVQARGYLLGLPSLRGSRS